MTVRSRLVLSAAAVLLLSGCAAGTEAAAPSGAVGASPSEAAAAAPSASSSAVPGLSPTPTPTAAAPSPTPTVRTIDAAYAGGQVTGTSGREEVASGEQVVLRISSDVAEEVHVHGYDLEQAVPAGGTADLPLTASIPGVFEVELHESGKVLFQLRVS